LEIEETSEIVSSLSFLGVKPKTIKFVRFASPLALKSKSKDGLGWIQNDVADWNDVYQSVVTSVN
jgi:hypothetical protein